MNLRNYYSLKQTLQVLGLRFRMQLKRLQAKEHFDHFHICGKPFYLKYSINQYMERVVSHDVNLRLRYEMAKYHITSVDLDLTEWVPRCVALEKIGKSHELLYLVSQVRTGFPTIRTRKAFGQHFFNVRDIERYLEKDRLQKTQ